LQAHRNAKEQLLRASQAVPLNIAEGNGKATDGDRRRYFEIARGSVLECGAIQEVLEVCGGLSPAENSEAKKLLDRIVACLRDSEDAAMQLVKNQTDMPWTEPGGDSDPDSDPDPDGHPDTG